MPNGMYAKLLISTGAMTTTSRRRLVLLSTVGAGLAFVLGWTMPETRNSFGDSELNDPIIQTGAEFPSLALSPSAEPPDSPRRTLLSRSKGGFARDTVAGSGQGETTLYRVTTLANSGVGSLRECLEGTGPRTCVFEVSGEIRAQSELRIRSPFITVAGQTAPPPGVVIRGSGMSIEASEVSVQHLRFRLGDDRRPDCCGNGQCAPEIALTCVADPGSRDGIRVWSSQGAITNIMIDHVSIAWALDEGFSVVAERGEISNLTFSNSIIAYGLDRSIHPDASNPSDPGHSKGVFISGPHTIRGFSFYRNLLAHNADRNIRIRAPLRGELINNVVYNWARGSGAGRTIELSNTTGDVHALDIIGNLYLPGPDTFCADEGYRNPICGEILLSGDLLTARQRMHAILRVGGAGPSPESRYFLSGNIGPTRSTATEPEWNAADRAFFVKRELDLLKLPEIRSAIPVSPSGGVDLLDNEETLREVLISSGARPLERDSVDAAAVRSVVNRSGTIIDCVVDDGTPRCARNGGAWPEYESRVQPFLFDAENRSLPSTEFINALELHLHQLSAELETGAEADESEIPLDDELPSESAQEELNGAEEVSASQNEQ
jgi:hypothetical protein